MADNKSCNAKYSGIGGQAVMEGVMMRNKEHYAVAVRKPDGEIAIVKDEYKGLLPSEISGKIPIVRGIVGFVDSLILGMRALNYSVDFYAEEELTEKADSDGSKDPGNNEISSEDGDAGNKEAEKNDISPEDGAGNKDAVKDDVSPGNGSENKDTAKNEPGNKPSSPRIMTAEEKKKEGGMGALTVVVMILAIFLAMGLFMVIPYYASLLFGRWITNSHLLALVEGLIRLLIFVIYIKSISRMEDIKRVFRYHGAEHKCINCLETGHELTPENVKAASREHRRCGTSFLLYVMVVSILIFALIDTPNRILRVALRIIFIPLIAGIAYEFIRLAGRSNNPFIRSLSAPGLMMQKLTTAEPDDEMILVGIASVEAVFDWREYLKENF